MTTLTGRYPIEEDKSEYRREPERTEATQCKGSEPSNVNYQSDVQDILKTYLY